MNETVPDVHRRRIRGARWLALAVLVASGSLWSWQVGAVPDRTTPLVATASATADSAGAGGRPSLSPVVADHRGEQFVVQVGDVHGLYPRARTKLPVTLRNPLRYGIRVYRLKVTGTSQTVGCDSQHLGTGTYRVSIILRPGAVYRTSLNLGLRPSATDSCKGAQWRVGVKATAVRR